MTDTNAMVEHALHTLPDFSSPPSARELLDRIVQVGRYDRREAQRSIQIALDRGVMRLGKGMRLEQPS